MLFLRKSTAVDVLIGPFLDDADGKTPETGLTIDVELSKNGQALANKSDSTAPTHDTAGSIDGYYNCELDTTDTNTTGTLKLVAFASGALHVFETFQVIEQDIYDAIFGSSADLITKINAIDTVVDAVKVVTDAISSNGSGLSAVPWNSSWDSEVQSEVNDALVALGLDHLVSASVAGSDVADNSIVAKLVSKESTADWDDYVNTTDSLQAQRDYTGSGYTAIPWNSSWDAEVQSECADALTAYDPPTKAEMDAMWTTAQTESYASDGAAATPAQLLYMIYCAVGEFSISSTTITGKKLDGSTTAMTWTIDDASSPTSRTRASQYLST